MPVDTIIDIVAITTMIVGGIGLAIVLIDLFKGG